MLSPATLFIPRGPAPAQHAGRGAAWDRSDIDKPLHERARAILRSAGAAW